MKLQHRDSGVVVTCDDDTAGRLGSEWQPIEDTPAPKRAKPAKADNN